MYYALNLESFPLITQYYTVIRNTVWQIADKDNIVILIKEGRCAIAYNGQTYTLNAGDVFFIPANHAYERRPIKESLCTLTYIHFATTTPFEEIDVEEINKKMSKAKQQLDFEILSGERNLSYPTSIYLANHTTTLRDKKLFEIIKNINLFSDKRQLLCNLQSSVVLCNILLMLAQETMQSLANDFNIRKSTSIPPKLRKAIGYIARHYSEQIKLETLAKYCNVSKQQLIRYFKNSMNLTPMNYITDYRLSRAKELLYYQPQLSIKEVSAELGFDNQRYFSRVFMKYNHETPTQYRNRTLYYHDENLDETKTDL